MRLTTLIPILLAATTASAQVPSVQTSPAQDRIVFATKQIAKNPSKSNLYVELAVALVRRERETSDKSLFDRAQNAVDKALKISAENLEAEKTQVAILLGRHEFQPALTLAQAINEKVPDDVMTYGYIADAEVELGDYAAAEKAAQWMLDLRTHNLPGLIRGADLRQIFGDNDGALQFLNDAYQETPPDQSEDIAWLLTRMAEIHLSAGKLDLAAQSVEKALTSFPDYYYSLEVQARVRNAQNKFREAAELLHRRNQQFPQMNSIYAEAQAWERAGEMDRAGTLFATFEHQSRGAIELPDNDNLDLVDYYISHKHNLSEALRISRLEVAKRHDVWTLDAYAQALFGAGKFADAKVQIEKAMSPGIQDAEILEHAALINAALKDLSAAERGQQTR